MSSNRRQQRFWSAQDVQYLKSHYADSSPSTLALHFRCTTDAVGAKAKRLGLTKTGWTPADDATLSEFFDEPIEEIAFVLGRSLKSIQHRAKKLGIRRTLPPETVSLALRDATDKEILDEAIRRGLDFRANPKLRRAHLG